MGLYSIKRQGLSPLTRGNRTGAVFIGGRDGSIPAHAGQPGSSASARTQGTVYPRSRGATTQCGRGPDCALGLSPLTRGNLGGAVRRHAAQGSIPAHAGQPTCTARSPATARVYPRSRGATHRMGSNHLMARGLSPLTRGNLRGVVECQPAGGSIPAHAGQPSPRSRLNTACRVYPRSRGATDASRDNVAPR